MKRRLLGLPAGAVIVLVLTFAGIVALSCDGVKGSKSKGSSIPKLQYEGGDLFYGDGLVVMVVGTSGSRLDPREVWLNRLAVADNTGRSLPWESKILAETKVGPAVLIEIDAKNAGSPVIAEGRITYEGEMYVIDAKWRRKGEKDPGAWILEGCSIRLLEKP